MLLKKLLVANFINTDITLNANHLIQSFSCGCGQLFESVELMSVMDSIFNKEEINIYSPDEQVLLSSIFCLNYKVNCMKKK